MCQSRTPVPIPHSGANYARRCQFRTQKAEPMFQGRRARDELSIAPSFRQRALTCQFRNGRRSGCLASGSNWLPSRSCPAPSARAPIAEAGDASRVFVEAITGHRPLGHDEPSSDATFSRRQRSAPAPTDGLLGDRSCHRRKPTSNLTGVRGPVPCGCRTVEAVGLMPVQTDRLPRLKLGRVRPVTLGDFKAAMAACSDAVTTTLVSWQIHKADEND